MWEYNTLEVLQDFTREPINMRTVHMFMEHFELTMYSAPACLRSASNLALVYGESEYSFNSDDLMWLACADTVALCGGEGRNLLFIGLNVDDDEYYVTSAAIIKIFNIVFPGNNQYIFKIGTSLAFGCKRDFKNRISNNFCVTQLFEHAHLKECVYFLEEALLSTEESLPDVVMQYSPQEKMPDQKTKRKNEASLDYLRILREINSIYGIDTTKEYTRYIESFAQAQNNKLTYSDTCAILHYVGEQKTVSSYDILEDAIEQEEKSHNDIHNRIVIPPVLGNDTLSFSPEAYEDAELLLKEMLRNG